MDAPCEKLRLIFASKELDGFAPQLVAVPLRRETRLPGLPIVSAGSAQEPTLPAPGLMHPDQNSVSSSSASGIFADMKARSDQCTEHDAEVTVTPSADSYVSHRMKRFNHGTAAILRIDNRPGSIALIKFDLSCLPRASIATAKLRVFAIDSSKDGGMVHVLTHDDESSWREDEVNWNTAPRSYNHFTQFGKVTSGSWNEVDISNAFVGKCLCE